MSPNNPFGNKPYDPYGKEKSKGAAIGLPLPEPHVPSQEEVENGTSFEGHELWRYLKYNRKDLNFGRIATDYRFAGNDWIAFLKEEDGTVHAEQVYSANHYDEVFIKKIVGYGETSKYLSNEGVSTSEELCKKLDSE